MRTLSHEKHCSIRFHYNKCNVNHIKSCEKIFYDNCNISFHYMLYIKTYLLCVKVDHRLEIKLSSLNFIGGDEVFSVFLAAKKAGKNVTTSFVLFLFYFFI
jgi:hypothetical protein